MRKARQLLGWSQVTLGRAVGLAPAWIINFEEFGRLPAAERAASACATRAMIGFYLAVPIAMPVFCYALIKGLEFARWIGRRVRSGSSGAPIGRPKHGWWSVPAEWR